MLAGRPVTLAGEWIWLDRATLTTLAAWADVPELEMTLAHPDGADSSTSCFARPALSDFDPGRLPRPRKTARRSTRRRPST